jgi:hypothetical protein
MSTLFRRQALAAQMTQQLLHPGPLDVGLRSGLFLSGLRRIGKTTFLLNDLIPSLADAGALVIYVDLWTDTQANPATLVQNAIKQALKDLEAPASSLLSKLRRIKGLDIGAAGFKLGFNLDTIGTAHGATLEQVLVKLVDVAQTNVVLIIDEVQQAATTEDGHKLLIALKAARDAVNLRPGTPGHFILIGTGSHRAKVNELTVQRAQAFQGATSVEYPVLDIAYIDFLLNELRNAGIARIPSRDVAYAGFVKLGSRPEEMIKALRQVTALPDGADPDQFFPVIAATLRASAADVELNKLERLGSLALAIFDRVASAKTEVKGLYSADAIDAYAKAIGRPLAPEEIQPLVNELLNENLIMRGGHGRYSVTDPFVQQLWLEHKALPPL